MSDREAGPGLGEEQAAYGIVGELDEMFDMANLTTRHTGVEGTIYISTQQGQHGPRIKWYPGRPGRDLPCLGVPFETPSRVINQGLPPRVARDGEREAVAWAQMNRDALLRFWADGLAWTLDEVNAFVEGLVKLR